MKPFSEKKERKQSAEGHPLFGRRVFLRAAGGLSLLALPLTALPFPALARENAMDLCMAGQDAIASGDFAGAVGPLAKAVSLEPENDWCWGLLGRAYHGLKKIPEAVAAFRKAADLNPSDTYSRMMLEMLTQRPVARQEKPQKPMTALELEAEKEERLIAQRLSASSGLSYQVRRVVIDPGHGGFDPGAVGKGGLKEKDVALDIALALAEILEAGSSVQTRLTRTGDYYVALSDRTAAANQFRADLFVSIHINAAEKRAARGFETYYCSRKASTKEAERVAAFENTVVKYDNPAASEPGFQIDLEAMLLGMEQELYWKKSGTFAETFQKRSESALPFESRGVQSANFFVLRRAKMPAILLEAGFISNPENESWLARPEFRRKIAMAFAKGFAA
ncbi:MAG: N-acetylmuramoyl-L-alanine amidase [Thermodesulfobacteriota bacterium]